MKQKNLHNYKSPFRTTLFICTLAIVLLSSCAVMMPLAATSNPVTPTAKVGKSRASTVLGFWIEPDAGIKAAAANGGITKIATVDVKITNYFFVYRIIETTVTGD
jgi:hypothetical protein